MEHGSRECRNRKGCVTQLCNLDTRNFCLPRYVVNLHKKDVSFMLLVLSEATLSLPGDYKHLWLILECQLGSVSHSLEEEELIY